MIEAIHDLTYLRELARETSAPLMVNQLHGGKSPDWTLTEMQDAGVSIVIYSTPALFAAQHGIQSSLARLVEEGKLPSEGTVTMKECVDILHPPSNYRMGWETGARARRQSRP
jgi:2-methylisocitrate lyase-like PEP mutase family enzyme